MRKYFSILTLSIGLFLHAQLPISELIGKTWYLRSMDSPFLSSPYNFSENSQHNEITLNFYLKDNLLRYYTTVCSTKAGNVSKNSDSMVVFENSVITGAVCTNNNMKDFESLYFSHIFGEQYWLNIVPDSNGTYLLNLSSPSFCGASFSDKSLSVQEYSKSNIIIYPNPVKEKLTVENPNSINIEIKITDASGKLILKQNANSASTDINFNKFSKGVYYVSIISKDKIIQSKKIIKH